MKEVPEVGLEPTPPEGDWILNPTRLDFSRIALPRHSHCIAMSNALYAALCGVFCRFCNASAMALPLP